MKKTNSKWENKRVILTLEDGEEIEGTVQKVEARKVYFRSDDAKRPVCLPIEKVTHIREIEE